MPEEPEPILPPDLFVCPITLSLDNDIRAAIKEEPAPPGGPDDHFSKACKLIPLKGLPTALETAEALFSNVFRHFGIPEDIMSDRGPQFISRVWRGFFKLLGCRAYCYDHQHDWSQYLPWAEYAQNSLHQESTKLTPFQCILGYQTPLFPWSAEPSELPTVDHWFRESERVWESAHIHLQRVVRHQKVQADVRRCDAPLHHSEPEVHPPPEIDTDDTIYQVREVMNSRRRRGRFKYLVDWEGYGPEERSWVDQNDILDPSLLVEFHQRHQGRPAPRGHGRPRRRSRASGDAHNIVVFKPSSLSLNLGGTWNVSAQSVPLPPHIPMEVYADNAVELECHQGEGYHVKADRQAEYFSWRDISLRCAVISRQDCAHKAVSDLNPIEHLWDVLDKQVRSMEAPPRNFQDLKDLLLTSWCQIPQHTFGDLVESMP
ncbi:hypothetical protein QTP86_002242 [Hemibagrus guttatus]|nr:hypothetical protein QTP86_002242 [Hemibagrus guttatus]